MEMQNFIAQITKFRMYPLITKSTDLSTEYNLSEEHMLALVMVFKQEDPFVSTIANNLFISISKASRIIRDLEKVGLILYKYGECKDRRKVKLETTPKGQEAVSSLFQDLMSFFNQLLAGFDEKELRTFTHLTQKFNTIADTKIRALMGIDAPDILKEKCDAKNKT